MNWKQILTKPSRIAGLIFGVALVFFSISELIGNFWMSLGCVCLNAKSINLIAENAGWITIVFSLREKIWTVKKTDLKKFIPISLMFFIIIFVYTIARQLKDAIVIPNVGVEGVVASKILVFVASALYQLFYIHISRKVSFSKLAYYAITPIVSYFLIFSFFLMGNKSLLLSDISLENLSVSFPVLAKLHLFSLLKIWPNIIYYVLSEVWAVTITMVFIWQIINQYINKEERTRMLGPMMTLAQIASLNTGLISQKLCQTFSNSITVAKYVNSIILFLVIILFLANKYLFSNLPQVEETGKAKKKESVDIVQMIKDNPITVLAAFLTVFYGLSVVWIEQFWKDKLKILAGAKALGLGVDSSVIYGQMYSGYMVFQSRICIVFALIGSAISNMIPWLSLALSTPLILFFGCFFIFGPFIFPSLFSIFGNNFVEISYFAGFIVLALFRSLKYICFDLSKEAYISSKDDDKKREIKNLEGMLGRIGKSGGSALSYVLTFAGLSFSSFGMAASLFISCLIISSSWIFSITKLHQDLEENKK